MFLDTCDPGVTLGFCC